MIPNHDAYRAAANAAVLLDRSDRVRLEIAGPDRLKFLHNLTTNEVKRLAEGQGVEAFVTSLQGKTLGLVTLLVAADRVILRTDPGGASGVIPHLARYGVFDDVTIDDSGAGTFEFHVAGPAAEAVVGRALAGSPLPPAGELRHASGAVRVVRESPLGVPGLTILGDLGSADSVRDALRTAGASAGLVDLDDASAEALRIEAGTPVFGRDVSADNLPQEVARDDRAINFVKGCYLGQETVARIDALGHVNRLLRGLSFEGGPDVPPAASVLEADGKPVGSVTSSAYSPGRGRPVALGYVRATQSEPGRRVTANWPGGRSEGLVVGLPFPPGSGGAGAP